MASSDAIRHGNGFKDRSGQRTGMLLVVSYSHTVKKTPYWLCKCDCGNESFVSSGNLRSGRTVSCGCYWRRIATKHGDCPSVKKSKEYNTWAGLKARCSNPNNPGWKNYGGRGISFCERWASFAAFLEDVGRAPSPKHTLDRIKNHLGYEPGNVRWATRAVQSRNRRVTRWITYKGETLCLKDWSTRFGVPEGTMRSRVFRRGVENGMALCESESSS